MNVFFCLKGENAVDNIINFLGDVLKVLFFYCFSESAAAFIKHVLSQAHTSIFLSLI